MTLRMAAIALVLMSSSLCLGEEVIIGDFSQGLENWRKRSFSGETIYRVVEHNGEAVLEAHAEGGASALYRKQGIDLNKTPYLHWSWRVEGTFEDIDQRTKAGDDYPARIYVVHRGSWSFWRTWALNYVWSSNQPVGAQWPNAYAGDNVQMLAVNSGEEKAGQWVTHVRNVREDFKQVLGMDLDTIDGVALMTDTDDTGQSARAWYGKIWFSDSPAR